MTGRKGHPDRNDSSSSTQQNKEDILRTKHTFPPTAPHIHPGALQQRREELLPVFPPTWKELSTVRTIFFFNQKLSPDMGTNVLFCGDSFLLPLLRMHHWTCSEMSTEMRAGFKRAKVDFVTQTQAQCVLDTKHQNIWLPIHQYCSCFMSLRGEEQRCPNIGGPKLKFCGSSAKSKLVPALLK